MKKIGAKELQRKKKEQARCLLIKGMEPLEVANKVGIARRTAVVYRRELKEEGWFAEESITPIDVILNEWDEFMHRLVRPLRIAEQ